MATALARKRDVPWLGMGTTGEWTDTESALYEAGLEYDVCQTYAYDDMGQQLSGILVNRRTDTNEVMGVTSDAYGVVQNREAFSLLDPFCASGGIIEHAGITEVGMVFMVMRMPAMAFGFYDDDFELYVCAMNSFNTRFPLAVIITPVRVFCQNMFRKLMAKSDTLLTIKHGRMASDRILSASKVTTLLLDYEHDMVESLHKCLSAKRDKIDLDTYVNDLLPLVPVDAKHPRAKQTNDRILSYRKEFVDDYYHAPDNEKYVGTKLGIINAYYDWISHRVPPMRASPQFESVRFGNLMNGSAVNRKMIVGA